MPLAAGVVDEAVAGTTGAVVAGSPITGRLPMAPLASATTVDKKGTEQKTVRANRQLTTATRTP